MELDSGLTGTNILYNSSTAFCFMYTWINLNYKMCLLKNAYCSIFLPTIIYKTYA